MPSLPRRAVVRSLSALTALLGSAALALAQLPIAVPALAIQDKDTPSSPITPVKASRTVGATPIEATPLAAAPRAVRPQWLFWPRLLTPMRHRIEDPCDHCGTTPPTSDELQRVDSGKASMVEVAAAKIKADEAAAPARRAAIRYLASVKCHYFPEAEAALISALRADRNECVRVEAAQALADCCCCTPKTMEALLTTVAGSERDGNPAEVSDRVKSAANGALQRYAARGMNVPHPDTLPPATKKDAPKELQLANFTTLPLSAPAAEKTPPRELQLTGFTDLPAPGRNLPTASTDTDRRSPMASSASARRPASSLPEIRLRPIGVIPPQ